MKLATALLLVGLCTPAWAAEGAFESAGALLKFMTGSDIEPKLRGFYRGYAFGYVVGIADAQDGVRNPTTQFCFDLPSGLSKGQVFQVVKVHLENRPESSGKAAESLVQEALDGAFPCKTTRSRS